MNFANYYEEKRNFIRMKVNAPIAITPENQDTPLDALCRDLSGNGLSVELPGALPLGTRAEIAIQSHHGDLPMLNASAVVRRVNGNLVGLEIIQMK